MQRPQQNHGTRIVRWTILLPRLLRPGTRPDGQHLSSHRLILAKDMKYQPIGKVINQLLRRELALGLTGGHP